MKASLITAALLLALVAAPTEAMERPRSTNSLPAAGGPLPLPRQSTVAQFKKEGGVPGRIDFFEQLGRGAAQPGQNRPAANQDRVKHVKAILARYRQPGHNINDQEVADFEYRVNNRHQQIRQMATAAAGRSKKNTPFDQKYAKVIRQQSQFLIAKINTQSGNPNENDQVEAHALTAAVAELRGQYGADGGSDLSDIVNMLIAAADAHDNNGGGLGFGDFGFGSSPANAPQAFPNSPAVREFREKESHERQKFERLPAGPERERREREAREMRAIFRDSNVLATISLAVLGTEPSQVQPIVQTVVNTIRSSGSLNFNTNPLAGGSVHGSRKREPSSESLSGSGNSLVISGHSPNTSPRQSLMRQGSESSLVQGKCYNENPMQLRGHLLSNQVPLKHYGKDLFTTSEIAKVESHSLTAGKTSLKQGALYSYVFGVIARRSALQHQGISSRFWQTSAFADLAISAGFKNAAGKLGAAARGFIPFRQKTQKTIEEEYVRQVAGIFYHVCIPQTCEQRDIYGFYKTLARGLNGKEAQFAMALIQGQLEVDMQRARTIGYLEHQDLPNPCPHGSSNPEEH